MNCRRMIHWYGTPAAAARRAVARKGAGIAKPVRRDGRVHGDVAELHVHHGAAVQLVLAGRRDAGRPHRLPVGQHQVPGHVAPDVVVVERAHAGGQPGGRVEEDGEGVAAHPVVHRGMGDAADRHARRAGDAVRALRHVEREQGRGGEQLALDGGEPEARHRVRRRVRLAALLGAAVAVDAGHVAGLGRHDLGEREGARGRVLEVAHPVHPRGARGHVGDRDHRRVAGQAHLAAGLGGLLGLPLPHGRLVGDGLDGGERVGAALGRDGAGHEVLASGLHGRAGRDHQRDGQRHREHHREALHGFSLPGSVGGGTVPGRARNCQAGAPAARRERDLAIGYAPDGRPRTRGG